ncbi:MAG: hypothetical protein EXS63_05500 [Candidatus Omnitrophica bacterium]|nr:hypothetical protein [Candidatus Omnitrophota bacterium]
MKKINRILILGLVTTQTMLGFPQVSQAAVSYQREDSSKNISAEIKPGSVETSVTTGTETGSATAISFIASNRSLQTSTETGTSTGTSTSIGDRLPQPLPNRFSRQASSTNGASSQTAVQSPSAATAQANSPASQMSAAAAAQPSAKITQQTMGANGFEVSVQVSPDVASFEILAADQVIGPYKVVDTIQVPNPGSAQILKWLDSRASSKTSPVQFYQVRIKTTISNPTLPAISQISIPEQGLTLDIPYYALTYTVTHDGSTENKTIAYDLKSGANTITIREKNQVGQEVVIQRTINYQTAEDVLTDAERAFRQTLINDNARYFTEAVGIDRFTGFPLDVLGPNASGGKGYWTQPTSIGFHLQFLGDIVTHKITVAGISPDQALTAAAKTLTSLLDAQTRFGWNGLIPWLRLSPLGIDRSQIVFLDNINLSQSVAAMLGSLEKANVQTGLAKDIYNKAAEFLAKQQASITLNGKTGNVYQQFYDSAAGRIYSFYDTAARSFSANQHADRLGNEIRSGIAFAVTYFGLPQPAWNNLALVTRSYITSNNQTVETIAPFDGGAFQVFWNTLRAPENEIAKMKPVLWNAFVAFTDFMQREKLPGFPSASAVPGAVYDGKIGIPSIAEATDIRYFNIGSLYALAAAYLLDPSKVLSLIQWVKTTFPQMIGPNGFYDAATKAGVVSQNYYAIDQGSFLVGLAGSGPSSMKVFLQKRNLLANFNQLYNGLNLNIQEAAHVILDPPTNTIPSTAAVENFDGNSAVPITGTDGVYQFTKVNGQGMGNSSAEKIDYTKKTAAPYAYIRIQTNGSVKFSDYTSFRFQFQKLSPGPVSLLVKFESFSGAPIEKQFNFPSGTTGWQEVVCNFPPGSSVLNQASDILIFADPGLGNTAGSFLIDNLVFHK